MEEEASSSPQLTPQGTSNVPDFILTCISRFNQRIAQVDSVTFKSITYMDITGRVTNLQRILSGVGIRKGDVIAILSKNTTDYCWIVLGCLATGAVCGLMNPCSTSREIHHYLDLVRPTVVIAEVLTKDQFVTLHEASSVRRIYTNYEGNSSEKVFNYDDLLSQTISGSEFINRHNFFFGPTLNEPALMLTSSGTTGMPKAVVLTHKNVIAALELSGQCMRHGGVALGLMPFFHAYGLVLMLMALCEGTKLIAVQKFHLHSFLAVVSTFGITHLHLVPSIVVSLGKSEKVTPAHLESVREVMTGAGPITYAQQAALKRKLQPSAKLYHSYGMTESTFVITFGEAREDKPGSIGKLMSGFKAKIVKENGELGTNGEVGELWVRGLMTFIGYHNNPTATEETLDNMRWLHTGDIVMRDNDGYFYHIERKKEFIKYQGFQVSPTEIEMTLLHHQSVEEAAVIGIQHETYGEVPMAFVVKKKNQDVTEDELVELVKKELSPYKQLRGGVHIVESIPRTGAGKVKRASLKEDYYKCIESKKNALLQQKNELGVVYDKI